jgi:hypothetical protein
MRLVLLHPAVANRSCAKCKEWLYDDKPGNFAPHPVNHGWGDKKRKGGKTPCWMCPKQPSEVPEKDRSPATAIDLSDRNWKAYLHYLECSAVNDFPKDEIVRQCASIIKNAEKLGEKVQQMRYALAMANPST